MSVLLPPRLISQMRQFREDATWYSENYGTLKTKYRGLYIIIKKGRVVMHDRNKRRLLSEARKRYGDDEVRHLFIGYISTLKDKRIPVV
jgi:hypothetical protein